MLVRTRNSLNIGAAARAMINFGLTDLRLVSPYDEAWQQARSAVGAARVLASAQVYGSLAEAVADRDYVLGSSAIGDRRPEQPVVELPVLQAWLKTKRPAAPALVFGQEKHGLTNEDLSHCHAILRIPTLPEQASMNLGQAVAVCVYAWSCSEAEAHLAQTVDGLGLGAPDLAHPAHPAHPANPAHLANPAYPAHRRSAEVYRRAPETDTERLGEVLHRLLQASGYLKPTTIESARIEIRALLHRLEANEQDTHRLTGMLAKIEHALRLKS